MEIKAFKKCAKVSKSQLVFLENSKQNLDDYHQALHNIIISSTGIAKDKLHLKGNYITIKKKKRYRNISETSMDTYVQKPDFIASKQSIVTRAFQLIKYGCLLQDVLYIFLNLTAYEEVKISTNHEEFINTFCTGSYLH